MAVLRQLRLQNFRNFAQAKVEFAPKLNLIVGNNAAGKTSVIEALWFLVTGRSFRSSQSKSLISHEQDEFVLFAELLSDAEGGMAHKVGLQKSAQQTLLKCDGVKLNNHAELALMLPIQMLTPESHKLLEEGPKARRQFIDWGCFHLHPEFLGHWRSYQRVLKQRNQALKQGLPNAQIELWDASLVMGAQLINQFRQHYIEQLQPYLERYIAVLMPDFQLKMDAQFRPGWPLSQPDLQALLSQNILKDRKQGFTQYGAHRADVKFKFDGYESLQVLSRGQQKLFVCALLLAQAQLQQSQHQESVIMLIDDLPAELDQNHRRTLMRLLDELDIQHIVTSTAQDLIEILSPEVSALWQIDGNCLQEIKKAEHQV